MCGARLTLSLPRMDTWHRLIGGGDQAIERARRPQRLADDLLRTPLEGIDWLGRSPTAHAPLLYRVLVALARSFLFGICRLRVEVTGREHLPHGGYLAVCAGHRSWIDPFLLIAALPLQPRVWFMGSAASAFDRRWKERLLHHTGGLLPVWRGGTDIDIHVRSARAVIDAGAVLAIFAEGRIGGPPDAPARLRSGAALLALRTGAPVVPVAVTGSGELYRGRRMRVDILPVLDPAELAGAAAGEPDTPQMRAELRQAHRVTRTVEARLGPAMRTAHATTIDPPSRRRRWRWLTRLLR